MRCYDLKGKTAVITGGSRGIGLAICKAFAKAGANIVVIDLDDTNTQKIESELYSVNHLNKVKIYVSSVTDVPSLNNIYDDIIYAHEQSIDILVNNAGITADSSLKKMTEDQFDNVLNINLKGVINCTEIFGQYMKHSRSGVILNASSVVAKTGNFGQANYVASKAAINGITESYAKNLGKYGIRVNAVAPGFTKSRMTDKIPESIRGEIKSVIPLGRFAAPEEIAHAYLFLASDSASYITGTVLEVDGGVIL